MRITCLCSDPGVPIGGRKGASVHLAAMARAFAELGHEVQVVARRGDPSALDEPAGGVGAVVPRADPVDEALDAALRTDPSASPGVAWTVGAITGAAAFRHAARSAVAAHEPDLIYERYALFGATGVTLGPELGVPVVLEVNAPLTAEQQAHRALAFAGAARTIEREILGRADLVVAVSSGLAHWLRDHGVAADRIAVLPNGVDVDRFRPAPSAGARAAREAPVVGFVGTLKPWHDVASLLRAVAAVRADGIDARLLVVGDGPERGSLEALARELDMDLATRFTGAVDHDDVPGLLAGMDVAAAPYAPDNGFYFSPLKLFEYLAVGLPVVAPAIGDLEECLVGAGAGWAYAPGDPDGLTRAVREALGDPDDAARRGRRGREHAVARHTWRHNAERVVALATRSR